ncbi:hypothetical protein SD53_09670 [Rheinheimera mesophila]|nr:hypothetical protein SD53_09670 [Rheinheimera mesophila]
MLTFVFPIGIHAEEVAPKNKTEETADVNNKVVIELKAQLQEMKIRNDLLENYQSSLLSTVHWSLSFMGGIALLLIGYGWWSNSKIHEKDKQQLKQEIATLLGEWEIKIKSDNADVINEQAKTIENRLIRVDEQVREVEKSFDNKLTRIDEQVREVEKSFDNKLTRIDEQVREVEKSFDNKLEKIFSESKKLHEKLAMNVESMASQISILSVGQIHLEGSMLHVEERVWDIKGVTQNILLTQTQGLDAAIKLGSDYGYRVDTVLERIKETLEKLIKSKNPTARPYLVNRLKQSLNSLDSVYSVKVSEILGILETIRVEEVKSSS